MKIYDIFFILQKKGGSSDDEGDFDSDLEFDSPPVPTREKTGRRAATKVGFGDFYKEFYSLLNNLYFWKHVFTRFCDTENPKMSKKSFI